MSGPARALAPAPGGLLERLLGAVRSEFRVDVYVPDPADPVLGRPDCVVPGCDRSGWEHGLCGGHGGRWRARGCPDLAGFLADPGPPPIGRGELSTCTVTGCRFGRNGFGLCMRHRSKWARSGQPDPLAWAGALPPVAAQGRGECLLPFCSLWPESNNHPFCKSHETRWFQLGRPDIEEYVAHCLLRGKARIDFRGLGPQLKLELQYAIQRRHDEASITAPPPVVTWALRLAAGAGVTSLLDHDEQQWRERSATKPSGQYMGFLLHAREAAERLRDGTGWEVEYPRDVWRLHTLHGLTNNPGKAPEARTHLRFDRVTQPWLRALAKRWCRLRLTCGLSIGTVVSDVAALTRFSVFLAQARPAVDALAAVDRSLLERYLAWLSTQPWGPELKEDCVTTVCTFFHAIRQHGWDDTLPTTAVFFTGDTPPAPTTTVPPARRARHGPGRGAGQPGPLAPPARTPAHPDPDQVRAAGLRRMHPGLGLPGPRRSRRPLPALPQPQDAPRSRRPHRRRTRN